MNSMKLEKGLQQLSEVLSDFDDTLVDVQTISVPGPNIADISRRRLLSEIDNDTADMSSCVEKIGEKIEQLKSLEDIL